MERDEGRGAEAEGDAAEPDGRADGEPLADASAWADVLADALAEADALGAGEVAVPAAESDPEEPVHPVSNRIPPSSAAAVGTPLNPDNVTLLAG
ncbi:hypothetical protein ACFW3D_28165 [Streptomyces sp. NPDC058864]